MTPLSWIALGIAGVNVFMALLVGVIYWRNHREVSSPFTWALLLFATFLVLHNAFQVYEFFTMMGQLGTPENLLIIEGLLQSAAIVALLVAAFR